MDGTTITSSCANGDVPQELESTPDATTCTRHATAFPVPAPTERQQTATAERTSGPACAELKRPR
jgi:hypothetical protein